MRKKFGDSIKITSAIVIGTLWLFFGLFMVFSFTPRLEDSIKEILGIQFTPVMNNIALMQTSPSLDADINQGDKVVVDLVVSLPNPDLGDNPHVGEIKINYDSKVLRGESIKVENDTLMLLDTIDNSNGEMSVDIAHVGSDGFAGIRTLVSFTFTVKLDAEITTNVTIDPSTTLGAPNIYTGEGTNAMITINKIADDGLDPQYIKRPVFRFWSDRYQKHFYTISANERNTVSSRYSDDVWKYERIAYYAIPYSGECPLDSYPVYRFWSDAFMGHFYTMSEGEKDHIIAKYPTRTWKYEKVAFCALAKNGTGVNAGAYPIYRFWSQLKNTHFYTISEGEKQSVITKYPDEVWKYEKIAFFGFIEE